MEQTKEIRDYLGFQKKLIILKYAREFKSFTKSLAEFHIPRSTYYEWKKAFDKNGEKGLMRKHPVAYNHPDRIDLQAFELL